MTNIKQQQRNRRHARVRSRVIGTSERPRLAVYRSNKIIYGQLIDDSKGETLASFDSSKSKGKTFTERANDAGKEIAKLASAKKVTEVVFDRGGYIFIGKVKAFAEGAREGGLKF